MPVRINHTFMREDTVRDDKLTQDVGSGHCGAPSLSGHCQPLYDMFACP
jgi:hypothetical protein